MTLSRTLNRILSMGGDDIILVLFLISVEVLLIFQHKIRYLLYEKKGVGAAMTNDCRLCGFNSGDLFSLRLGV